MKINYKKLNNEVQAFDENMINLTFNTSLTESQKKAGVIGKVTIMHPAFTTRATMFEKDGVRSVQGASRLMDDNETWFNIVRLTESFRDYILEQFAGFEANGTGTPWYLRSVGNRTKAFMENIVDVINKADEVDVDVFNEDFVNKFLDIKDISYSTKMSDSQKKAGIIAKASVETSIGSVRGYTIFKSKFGNSLFGSAQTEDEDNEIPAYVLSPDCEAQVLALLHNGIEDWTIEVPEDKAASDAPFDVEAQKKAIKDAVEGAAAVSETGDKPKAKGKGKGKKASSLFKNE